MVQASRSKQQSRGQEARARDQEQRRTLTPDPRSLIPQAAFALALLGLALRLAFALLPLSIHLIVLEDDAWMVTAIARNLALGHGITADGLHPTTGFQPLYPLTLGTLPYLVAPNALDAGFTANMVICALLNALAAWPLWALARRLGGDVAGLVAVALFALNPLLIRASVNAMETSLGLLLLLTLFAAFDRLDLTKRSHVLLLALLTALATLARLDASLAFAAITLTWLWRVTSDQWRVTRSSHSSLVICHPNNSSLVTRHSSLITYIIVTFVFLAPYFAFNVAVSGTFGPSSGAALAYMHSFREEYALTNGLKGLFLNSAINLAWLSTGGMIVVLLLGMTLFALVFGRRFARALPLLLYLPVPLLYYGYVLQQVRERYFVGLSAVLIILLAWLGAELSRRVRHRTGSLLLAGATLGIIGLNTYGAYIWYHTQLVEPHQTQPTAYQAAGWIRSHLPPDALIGAKNSGIYQYYTGHVVLNIDGKLNHAILPVMEQRTMLPYLRAQGVQYLVDTQQTMADHVAFYSDELGHAPHHYAPTLIEQIEIYGKILANRLGAHLPLHLDSQTDFTPVRPFTDVAEIVQSFKRPNTADNPVVIYRLK